MTKPSATQAPTNDAHTPPKKAPIVQIMEFDANQFASNWEQSESFLKELRYERLQLQKRILNKMNASDVSVLEQGLLSSGNPKIKMLLMEIIGTFSEDEQIQFLRTVLIRNPDKKADLKRLYPKLDEILSKQFKLDQFIKTESLVAFFSEYSNKINTQQSAAEFKHWINDFYTRYPNILLDAIKTNNFNLFKEIFNITAILNQRVLLDSTGKILDHLIKSLTFTAEEKNSIKQMLIELTLIHSGEIQQIPLSNVFKEGYFDKRRNYYSSTTIVDSSYSLDGLLAVLSGDSSYPTGYGWIYSKISSLEQNLIELHQKLGSNLTERFRKLIEIHLEYCHGVPQQTEQDALLNALWAHNLDQISKQLESYDTSVSRLKNQLIRNDYSAPLLHLNENLDESHHLLGLLKTIEFVQTSQLIKKRHAEVVQPVITLAHKIVKNQSLWDDIIYHAQQDDDPEVIVYLLKLLSALAKPMGAAHQSMVPESDVLVLLNELLESFKKYPDQIERFLTTQIPPSEIALTLLFLLPLDKQTAILTQNQGLKTALKRHVTAEWCLAESKKNDLKRLLNALMLLSDQWPDDNNIHDRIIDQMYLDGDVDDQYTWHDVADLTKADLNTLYRLVQWHQKYGTQKWMIDLLFNETFKATVKKVIKESLGDRRADVQKKAIGLFFLLPASLRASLLHSGESAFLSLLVQALPKTEAELSPILEQVIQNDAENDLISVLNAYEPQDSLDVITNQSGENLRFRLQRSIISKGDKSDTTQVLGLLNSRATSSSSENEAFEQNMLLCATMLFDENNRDAIKDQILAQLQRPEWLNGLEHARPHQIRTLLLTLMSLEKDLPSDSIAQYKPFFTPVLKDVRLFLESETNVHQTSNAFILDLLLLLPAEQQQSLLKDKPILKKRISEILNKEDWYQQQISNKQASSFFKAWALQYKPDWPLVDFKTMEELCDFLTELNAFSEDRRMAFLSRTISTKNKNNIWSHIREQILKNTELLLQNNPETQEKAFGKLIPIFLLLTDAQRLDVLSFETYIDGKKIKDCIGDALFNLDGIKNMPKVVNWKPDYDEYRTLHQQLHRIKQLVETDPISISREAFPWVYNLLADAYHPPYEVSKKQVANCLLDDKSIYSTLSLHQTDPYCLKATLISSLLLSLIKELLPEDQERFLNQKNAGKPTGYCLDDALIKSCAPVERSIRSGGYVVKQIFRRDGNVLNQILQIVLDLEKKDPAFSLPRLLKEHPKLKSLLGDFLLKSDGSDNLHISVLDSGPLLRCLEIVFEQERRFESHVLHNSTFTPLLEAIYLNQNVSANVIETFLLSAPSMMLSTLICNQNKNEPLMLIGLLKRLSPKQAYNVLSKHDIMLNAFLTGDHQRIFDLFDQMDGFDITQQADLFKKFDQKIREIPEAKRTVVFKLIDENPMVSFRYHSLKLAYESQTIFNKQYNSAQEQQDCVAALDLYQRLKSHQSMFTANNSWLPQALLHHLIDATNKAIAIRNPGLKQTVETIQAILLKQDAILMKNTANKAALETLKSQLLAYGNKAESNVNLENIATKSPNLQGLESSADFYQIFLAHQDNLDILKSLAELVKTLDYANQQAIFNDAKNSMSNELYQRFLTGITPRYDAPVQDVSMNDLMTLFAESMEGAEETPIQPTNDVNQAEGLKQRIQEKIASFSAEDAYLAWLSQEIRTFLENNTVRTTEEGWNILNVCLLKDPGLLEALLSYLRQIKNGDEPLKQWLLDKTADHGYALEIAAKHQPASFKPLFEAMTSLSMDAQLEIIIPIIERFETLPKDIKKYLKSNVQFYQIVEAHARKIRKDIELQILKGSLQNIKADWKNPETIDECYQTIQRSIKTTPQTNEEKKKKALAQNTLMDFIIINTLSDTSDGSMGSLLLEWGKKLDPKVLSQILSSPGVFIGSGGLRPSPELYNMSRMVNLLIRGSINGRAKHVSTLFALINVAYKPDRADLIIKLSNCFLSATKSLSYHSLPRDVTIAFLQHLFKNIKQLPIATQADFFEKMHRNPAMRCFASLSNEAKRDFHLIELAHKVHELGKKSIQGTDQKKKEHHQSAKSITQNLHDTLLKISIEHDQTSTMTKDQSSLWFSSIEDARKRLAPIQKNLFNMNNLFQRLWHSMERILGLTSVTKEHLFTELNRYRFLNSRAPSAPSPSAPSLHAMSENKGTMSDGDIPTEPVQMKDWITRHCTKDVSERELFSKTTRGGLNVFACVIRDKSCNKMPEALPLLMHRLDKEQRYDLILSEKDLDLTRFIKEESNEMVKKHLYLLRLEDQLFRAAGVRTLTDSQLTQLSQLHDQLLSELTQHEQRPLSKHETQRHQVTWNNKIQVCMAALTKEANQSSWLPWLFPSKQGKAIAHYKQFIQEMENDLKSSNPLNQRR